MTKQMGKSVTSIRIDDNLWKAARIYAIKKGTTLTELIERLLREELQKDPEIIRMMDEWE
ncbi:MAG: hypothetical protein QXS98_07340 [Candidatus Nitrosocaldus sp.]